MQARIDSAAGPIWRYLNEHGEITLSKLKQGTKLSDQLLFAGIGWLGCEDKLTIVRAAPNVMTSGISVDNHTLAALHPARGVTEARLNEVPWGTALPESRPLQARD